jgi:hypothetical protein
VHLTSGWQQASGVIPLAALCRHREAQNTGRQSPVTSIESKRCGCSSMVELQLPKLLTWVRFPSPAPLPSRTDQQQPGRSASGQLDHHSLRRRVATVTRSLTACSSSRTDGAKASDDNWSSTVRELHAQADQPRCMCLGTLTLKGSTRDADSSGVEPPRRVLVSACFSARCSSGSTTAAQIHLKP